NYCKQLNFYGLEFSRIGPKLKILNYSRVLVFVNRNNRLIHLFSFKYFTYAINTTYIYNDHVRTFACVFSHC
ncbi:MAG: hypothetical protein PV344_05995, partial [Anaplasma sp.]|nr:hypothetical protein [Anaplasma sp.]